VEEQPQMVLARSKLRNFHARGTCILERKMLRAGANTELMIFGVNVDYSDNQQALRNVEGKQRPLSLLGR
jgi:hypothetical protein